MICYGLHLLLVALVGTASGLGAGFFAGLLVAAGIAAYHFTLIRDRDRIRCLAAFRHNNWLGAAVFVGIALG